MTWPPHITVATVVERTGEFLVVEEQVAGRPVFNQPAGHLEPGETLFDAALRETLEETGWEVELRHITGVYHYVSGAEATTYHRICFAARPVRQTDRALDPDICGVHWLAFAALQTRNLRSPLVTLSIEDYLAGRSVPLDFIKHIH